MSVAKNVFVIAIVTVATKNKWQMDSTRHVLAVLTKKKLKNLIKLTTTGFKSDKVFIKKDLKRAGQLQWLYDQVWELDSACWKDGVRYPNGLAEVAPNCFCCKVAVGSRAMARQQGVSVRHHCRRCGRLTCTPCSKNTVKLWTFWDVDTETLQAWKHGKDRERLRTCDLCVKDLRAKSEDINDAKRAQTSALQEQVQLTDAADIAGEAATDELRMMELEDEDVESTITPIEKTQVCCVCECDVSFLPANWGVHEKHIGHEVHNEEIAKAHQMEGRKQQFICTYCKIDTANIGLRRRTTVFLNGVPPTMSEEDIYDNVVHAARLLGRLEMSWEIARCEITLDQFGMPFLSDTGNTRAIVHMYDKDAQVWLLKQKFLKFKANGSDEECQVIISTQPLGVWERGGLFTLNLEAAIHIARKKLGTLEEEKVRKKMQRMDRRVQAGILRCPGRLGGCVGGETEQQELKTGRCPECGGFRVSRDELIKGHRSASYDDAIVAARMNDETRLNGIFSLKAKAVTKGNKKNEIHFTKATYTRVDPEAEEMVEVGKGFRGQTALHVASTSGAYESVKVLLNLNYIKKLDPNSAAAMDRQNIRLPVDMYGSTPMHMAAMAGHSNIIELFISLGAMKIANNCMKRLPLHYAAANGHLECCKILLQSEKEQLFMKDIFDLTAFDLAKQAKVPSPECVAFLSDLSTNEKQ